MNNQEAREILIRYANEKGVSDFLSYSSEFPFSGKTIYKLGNPISVIIGFDGYSTNSTLNYIKKANNIYVLNSGFSIAHETDHYITNLSYNSNEFNIYNFMSEIISIANPKLYQLNYSNLPHEISAELSALKSVKTDTFFNEFSDTEINNAIIEREKFGLQQKRPMLSRQKQSR